MARRFARMTSPDFPPSHAPADAPAPAGGRHDGVLALAWRLFRRDVTARYRHTVLGVLWAVITPLFLVGLLLVLDRSGVAASSAVGDVPPVAFAIAGVTIWGIFATGISAAAESLRSAGTPLLRSNFPRGALVIAAIGMALFEFLVRLPVVVAIWAANGVLSPAGLLLGLLSLLPLLALTSALGAIAAVVSVRVRDLAHLIPIMLTVLMLASPVLYDFPPESPLGRLNASNPLGHFLATARGLFAGRFRVADGYWLSSLAAVVVSGLAWRLFHVSRTKLLEWM
jgi:lipopolysaccharide transport system permease protein